MNINECCLRTKSRDWTRGFPKLLEIGVSTQGLVSGVSQPVLSDNDGFSASRGDKVVHLSG